MKILLIDNYDSFTFNLYHYLSSLKTNVEVFRNDQITEKDIIKKKYNKIVISPGPGNPKNYPITSKIYKKYKGKKKIIGICLGFQHILFCEGAKIVEQKKIYHGFQSNIKVITNKSLFKKGKIFKVGRYHSLKLKEPFKSNNFEITMRCLNSKVAMAFENQKEKIYGFQFHPESFLTINGKLLIKKILSA